MNSARLRKGDEAAICRIPPTKEERSIMTFLWNPKTKTVMGRTGTSWAKIGLFYVVFYFFLAAFFSFLMGIFYNTLNYNAPKYTGADSLLNNPGLGFRPRTFNDDDLRPTITYNPTNPDSYAQYVESLGKYWEPYLSRPSSAGDCLPGDGYRKESDPVCYFDVDTLNTTCNPANLWGYNTTSPCILLKLNKMFHWKPQPLESVVGLPEGLKQHINASESQQEMLQQNVWVWCESKDVELEQVSPGLPLSYFPYHMQDGYLAPFVPVRLLNLTGDLKVKVQCRVWASNVEHKSYSPRTSEVKVFVHVK